MVRRTRPPDAQEGLQRRHGGPHNEAPRITAGEERPLAAISGSDTGVAFEREHVSASPLLTDMMPRRASLCAFLLAVSALSGQRLQAQIALSTDAAFNSQYQYRGITTTNRPVLQPQGTLTMPLGVAKLAAGVFANLEMSRYNDSNRHISENGGERAGLTEYDVWAEATAPMGRTTFTVGALHYAFPNGAGTTSASNTTELYVKAGVAGPLSPSLTVWNDVQRVRGAYAEMAMSQAIGAVTVSATTGWNIGQTVGEGSDLGVFTRRGFTHADVAVTTTRHMGRFDVTPSLHAIIAGDARTAITAPNQRAGLKIWAGTTLHLARILPTRRSASLAAAAPPAGGASKAPRVSADVASASTPPG